jgi:cation-transporting ATPase 13A1
MGLKQGDTQMTAVGLVTAGLFFFVSQAKPLLQLSSQRPPASIFNKSVLISIIGQFITHLTSLYCTIQLCHYYNINLHNTNTTYYNVKNLPDSQFQPNLFNTTIFILSFCIQISNFIVNYRGYPYTENIWDNKLFWRSLQGIYMIIIIVISGFFEPLNDLLQLVLIPNDTTFYYMYLMILIFDLLFAYLSEKISQQFE